MLRALRIGMVWEEVYVDVAGSGAQVCEKQASTMAYLWLLCLLLLCHYHKIMLRASLLRYPGTEINTAQKSTRTNIIVDCFFGDVEV